MGDVLIGVVFIFASVLAFTVIGLIVARATGEDLGDLGSGEDLPTLILAISLIGQQVSTAVWPFIVSRWKGLGVSKDFGVWFKPIDLVIGPALGVVLLVLGLGVGALTAVVLGGVDTEASNNAGFLSDAKGSPWLYVLVAGAVLGAPISEELMFRGLIQRSIQNRAGVVSGVVLSTAIFAAIHWIGRGDDGSFDGQIVLWATIGSVGFGLAVTAAKLGRIVPGMIAHAVFNAVGTAAELWA